MPEPKRPLKVFLCHAHADRDRVHALYDRLTKDGVDAWLDKEKLLPGQDWELEIPKAVREADVVVVCLSKQFNQAGYRQKEVRIALETAMEQLEGDIFIIPSRLEECDVPEKLQRYHWVDLFGDNGYEKLMQSLRLRDNQLEKARIEKEEAVKRRLPFFQTPSTLKNIAQRNVKNPNENIPVHESVVSGAAQQPAHGKPKAKPRMKTEYIVAIIGAAATIIAGILGSPLIEKWISPLPIETGLATKAFTVTYEPIIPSFTLEPSLPPTETISPTDVFIPKSTVVPIIGEWLLDFDWQCDGKDVGHNLIVFYSDGKLVSFMGTSTTIAGRATWKLDGVNITWTYPEITYTGKVITEEKMSGTMGDGGSCWTTQRTEITDGKGVSMVLVPVGEFTMGSVDGNADERPVHTVFLSSFYIDKYEVTNSRYSACVATGGCQPPIVNSSETRSDYYGNPEFNNYPVIYVNLNMAETYCAWRGTHLPTEAEWEKAAGGPDGRTYPWGENISCDYLNFNKCVGDTTSVGSYETGKSHYGLYDMAGNVWEWVADWYDENYYSISPFENPKGPSFLSGSLAIVRGGSWSGGTEFASRITNRASRSPDKADIFIGFRCARNATP